jgi:hypothetical protein
MVKYRKTKEDVWVAFGPAAEVVAGQQVTVSKAGGGVETRKVLRVGKPFQADGVMCVYGYLEERAARGATTGGRIGTGARNGRCRECRGPIKDAPHHRAMGGLCGSCAFDEYDC